MEGKVKFCVKVTEQEYFLSVLESFGITDKLYLQNFEWVTKVKIDLRSKCIKNKFRAMAFLKCDLCLKNQLILQLIRIFPYMLS